MEMESPISSTLGVLAFSGVGAAPQELPTGAGAARAAAAPPSAAAPNSSTAAISPADAPTC